MNSLLNKHCRDYSKKEAPMNQQEIEKLLIHTPKWRQGSSQKDSEQRLYRTYSFDNFQQTMSFVNEVAEVAETQDHHPHMEISYSRCKISYNTHTVNGITENDFICAARIDAIIA